MSQTSSKVYKINPQQQLIDLNNDVTNFRLTFNTEAVNEDQTPNPNGNYQLLVVNQTQLDNKFTEKTPFKKVKGSLGGKIKTDNDTFQNYFLILKANTECFVNVTISLEEIESKEELVIAPSPAKSQKWKNYVWIGVGVAMAILLSYYIYKKCKQHKNIKTSSNDSVASEATSDFENESISNEQVPKTLPPIIEKKSKPKEIEEVKAPPPLINSIQTPKPAIFNTTLKLESVENILDKFNS